MWQRNTHDVPSPGRHSWRHSGGKLLLSANRDESGLNLNYPRLGPQRGVELGTYFYQSRFHFASLLAHPSPARATLI